MRRNGFTLIELLVVIVVIGILSTIAILKHAQTRENAYLVTMKSDLRTMLDAEVSYFADSQAYTTALPPSYYASGDVTGPTITVNGNNLTGWVGNPHTTRTCAIFIGDAPLPPALKEGEPQCS